MDAIKHQAKTVTVGISRSEEALLSAPLVQAVLDAGAPDGALSYRAPARPRRAGPDGHRGHGLHPLRVRATRGRRDHRRRRQGGVAEGMQSRTDADNRLLGAKHRAATEREVTVAVGGRDGAA